MADAATQAPVSGSAEQTVAKLVRELRAISNCNQTLLRAVDEQTLLDDICRIVCREAGYRMAWVGFAEDDDAKSVRPVASAGFEDGYLERAAISWADTERGRGPVGIAIRTKQTVCVQECITDPRFAPWRSEALRNGFRAVIALPLKNENGAVFGSLSIYSAASDAFNAEEVRMLEELAGDLAFGVTVLRGRAERRRIDERLQANLRFFECMDQVNLAIQETNDIEQMTSRVLDAALSAFECDRAWLTQPCDANPATWRMAMERARPGHSSSLAHATEFSPGPELLGVAETVLSSSGPAAFDSQSEQRMPGGLTAAFGIQSMLCAAVPPRAGEPYMLSLHQCSRSRIWSDDEKSLFVDIGRRFADGLTSLIAYRDLRDHETRLHTLVHTIPDLVWLKDVNGVYLGCNAQFERLAGVAETELVGKTDYDFFDRELADFFTENDRQSIAGGKPRSNEEWLTFAADGYRGLFETIKTPMRDGAGNVIGVLGVARDITERKKTEEELRIGAAAFEAQEGIAILDASRRILRVNRAFTAITGYDNPEVMGKTPTMLRSDRHDEAFFRALWDRINNDGSWKGEVWYRRKNGELYPAWFNTVAVRGDSGEISHYVATMVDLTERKAAEKQIEHLAYYDSLTQLPNRRLFCDRLQQAFAGSARSGKRGAVLFIGLDNFKILNETAGHDVGDKLLVEVARRIVGCVRNGDTVARIGGDEFVVLLEELSDCAVEAGARAQAAGEKILAALGEPYALADRLHHSVPSVGVTLFDAAASALEELLKQADIAMYQAQLADGPALRFFDPETQDALAARTALESALRSAIRDRQFVLHYQPQVDARGRIVGAEALLRWQDPERGLVPPGDFIPLAEETGLIAPLGQWALDAACAQLKAWSQDPRARHLHLSVNVSARQFRQADFVDEVRGALERSGAPANRLKLELTESLFVGDFDGVVATMRALKALGVGFSMDDFGTGYSSLAYLTRLPLDQLKIDRSFVRNLPDSANDAAVAQIIITLAKSLGLEVVAEGVETAAQREFLARHGCSNYQGFLYSRPVEVAQFEKLLA